MTTTAPTRQMQIITPTGDIQYHSLAGVSGIVNIGRRRQNTTDILLAHPMIAEYQAVLDCSTWPWRLMALSGGAPISRNGMPLPVDQFVAVAAWDSLEIAEYTLLIQENSFDNIPVAASAPRPSVLLRSENQTPVTLELTTGDPKQEVDLGQSAVWQFLVTNIGARVARFDLGLVSSDPRSPASVFGEQNNVLIDIAPQSLELSEGEEASVTVKVTPLRREPPSVPFPAGDHLFKIVISSPDYGGRSLTAQAHTLSVKSNYSFDIDLSPSAKSWERKTIPFWKNLQPRWRNVEKNVLVVQNKGNGIAQFRVEGWDLDRACAFEFPRGKVGSPAGFINTSPDQARLGSQLILIDVQPGAEEKVVVGITPHRRRIFSRTRSYDLRFAVQAVNGARRELPARLMHPPLFGIWALLPLFILLFALTIFAVKPRVYVFSGSDTNLVADQPIAVTWRVSPFANDLVISQMIGQTAVITNSEPVGWFAWQGTKEFVVKEGVDTFKITVRNWIEDMPWLKEYGSAADYFSVTFASAPMLSIANTRAHEYDKSMLFTISLSAPGEQDVTFDLLTRDGSAVAAENYIAQRESLTIPAGQTSTTYAVDLIDNTVDAADVSFTVAITNLVHATAGNLLAVGTIDDDEGIPSIALQDMSASEADGAISFAVRLSNPSTNTVQVDYKTQDGTALAGKDYALGAATLIFPPNSSDEQVITIPILNDNITEGNLTFLIQLSNPQNATIDTPTVTGTILEDEATSALSIDDMTVDENARTLAVVVKLAPARPEPVMVDYTTVDGSAVAGSDYTATKGTITIPARATSVTINIEIKDDGITEEAENFAIKFSNPTNAILRSEIATATITDNDGDPLLTITDGKADEDAGEMNFTLRLSTPSSQDIAVNFSTDDDSATAGADYTARNGVVTIPKGQTETTVAIRMTDDAFDEADETFTVNLNGAQSAIIDDGQAIGTIIDNDGTPTIAIADVAAGEASSPLVFTVKLSNVSNQAVIVTYRTQDASTTTDEIGPATAGEDYTSVNGTLTIDAGKTDAIIEVTLNNDALDEKKSETFSLVFSDPQNATLSQNSAAGTIIDDDGLPILTLDDSSVTESAGTVNLALHLSKPSAIPVTVNYQTKNETAIASQDYTAVVNGSATIDPGKTMPTNPIVIAITNDATAGEDKESFLVELFTPTNAESAARQARVTINDEDPPPTVSIDSSSAAESSGKITFNVTLSAISARDVTVNYQTADETAIAGNDYIQKVGNVVIPASQTATTIVVSITADAVLQEGNETFLVTLNSPENAQLNPEKQAGRGTIVDDTDKPQLSINNAKAREDEEKLGFAVTLSRASATVVTVAYETKDGSATNGSDYNSTSGVLRFNPGEIEKTIEIRWRDDQVVEETEETFSLLLTNPENAKLEQTQAIGTIVDDDRTISIANATATEGDKMRFTLTLSSPSAVPVTVDYSTANDTAVSPTDYKPITNQRATFAPDRTEVIIEVEILIDNIAGEGDEQFFVDLSNPQNASLGTTRASGTITDQNTLPTLSVADAQVDESGELGFTVQLSGPSIQPVMVDYATTDGTAQQGTDYRQASGKLTIPAGQLSIRQNISTIDDGLDEDDETLILRLSNAVGALLTGEITATGTIKDNDNPPDISISNVRDSEAVGTMIFTVKLSVATSKLVTIDYQTRDGKAKAPGDYTSSQDKITMKPGETIASIPVAIINDNITGEGDEIFTVELTSASNAQIAVRQAEGQIIDDDLLPEISINDVTANEEDKSMEFTVTLSPTVSTNDVKVDYRTLDGTATAGSDYKAKNKILTIKKGNPSATIKIDLVDDSTVEETESFTVELFNSVNADINKSVGTGTIVDNDPYISISDGEAREDAGDMIFTVTLSVAALSDVKVDFRTQDVTAIEGSDYSKSNGSVAIPKGQLTAEIRVPIKDDQLTNEGDETFTVEIRNAKNGELDTAHSIGTGKIIDNDGLAQLSISDANAQEKDKRISFTIQLVQKSAQDLSATYQTVNDSAEAGNDYEASNNSVIIKQGNTSIDIVINLIDDNIKEFDENFIVRLLPSSDIAIVKGDGVGTIQDDD